MLIKKNFLKLSKAEFDVFKNKKFTNFLFQIFNKLQYPSELRSRLFTLSIDKAERGSQFEIKKQFLQNFEKSNQNTYCLQRPLSYISEWIQKGDLLSDCSASDKGELALGKNLFVGYMSWEGLNFEDAVLINEQILSKYMSLHIEKYEIEICEDSEKILTSNINSHKFEKNGLPKIGAWIQEGEILIGKLASSNSKGEPSILLTHEKLLYDIVGENGNPSDRPGDPLKTTQASLQPLSGIQRHHCELASPPSPPEAPEKCRLRSAKGRGASPPFGGGAGVSQAQLAPPKGEHIKYFQAPSSGRIIRICYTHASQLSREQGPPFGGTLSPEAPPPTGSERSQRERGVSLSVAKPIGGEIGSLRELQPFTSLYKNNRSIQLALCKAQRQTNAAKRHIKRFNIFPLVCSPKIAATEGLWLWLPGGKRPSALASLRGECTGPPLGAPALLTGSERSQREQPRAEGRRSRPSFFLKKKNRPNFLHSLKTITIYIAEKRVFKIGDKISGRHGNKGIISQILSKYDMPYLPNGFPLDVLLNPLGVPSRMNVGQIFECLLGFAGQIFQTSFQVLCFDEIYGYEASRSLIYSKLFESCKKTKQKWLLSKERPGKLHLFDGRTGELFNQSILVGSTYLMKLLHIVDEKIHARATGPYSLITQQPLRGRAKHGGQRFGEMEVWALQGFGIAYAIQELLTVKSDDLQGRNKIMQTLLKNTPFKFGTPESLRVVLRELQCLCLQLEIKSSLHFSEAPPPQGGRKRA